MTFHLLHGLPMVVTRVVNAAAVSGWEAIVTMVPFGLGRPCPNICINVHSDCMPPSKQVCRQLALLHDLRSVPCSCAHSAPQFCESCVDFGFPCAALVLVARFLLQMNFMLRRGSMFLLIAVAVLAIAAQQVFAPQRRSEVPSPW